jgi:transposase
VTVKEEGAISSATIPRRRSARKSTGRRSWRFWKKNLKDTTTGKLTLSGPLRSLASHLCKRYLTITESNNIRIGRASIREPEKYDAKWFLETNDDTISVEDATCGYKGLMVIERAQIRMTPVFHWVPRHIETHVKICVLDLLIERVA